MSRKSELLPISESTALFKKQLELSVVLIQSLCRTLIKNGENSFTVQKKREELLSSLNSLANWISGEVSIHSPQKSLLCSKQSDVYPKDFTPTHDDRAKVLQSRSSNRRKSMIIKQDQKLAIDFPKIKIV